MNKTSTVLAVLLAVSLIGVIALIVANNNLRTQNQQLRQIVDSDKKKNNSVAGLLGLAASVISAIF